MYSPHELYEIWHSEINLFNDRYVRKMVNFQKFNNSSKKIYFDKCCVFLNNNNVNPTLYFRSIIDYHNGYVRDYSILGSLKSVNIYNKYMKQYHDTDIDIQNELKNSIIYVCQYMIDKKYNDFDKYLEEDKYLIPRMIKHLSEGKISLYFISLIPNMEVVIENYPKDVILTYLKNNYKQKLQLFRTRALLTPIGEKLNKNFYNKLESVKNRLML